MCLAASAPALGAAMILGFATVSPAIAGLLVVGSFALSIAIAFRVRRMVLRPLENLSNLVAGIREGDFSFRARDLGEQDALGLTLREINTLADALRTQRLGALEATALLRKVMQEIDVAVFAFDEQQRLRLSNRAGERLLGQPLERLQGHTAGELGLADVLEGDVGPRIVELAASRATGRWQLRRGSFHQGGRPMTLIVLSDLSQALRDEEHLAWRRLIRVISHEINNSLAPIASLAETLQRLLARTPRGDDWEQDLREGLGVIEERAGSLTRFMDSYARLARLPPPRLRAVEVGELLARVASLEQRVRVVIEPGPEVTIEADPDQLEQLLINVVRNAADATIEVHGAGEPAGLPAVEVSWSVVGGQLGISLCDRGPGVSEEANLFVPFYSTKPGGSGIGLALSRQIAEAHGGSIELRARGDGAGCRAELRLPVTTPH